MADGEEQVWESRPANEAELAIEAKFLETAQKLIEAVNAGKVKLNKSKVIGNRLFVYRADDDYVMADPANRIIGDVTDTNGSNLSQVAVIREMVKLTGIFEDWIATGGVV